MDSTLREVVERLAPLERAAGSQAEREAAEWLAERLRAAGAASARVEEVPFRPGYAALMLPLGVAGVLAGVAALVRRGRVAPAAVAAAAAAAIADDAANGRRPWRRLVTRERVTWNVVAEIGDPAAPRTLAVLAHHDAAPTGRIFDQTFQRALAARFPDYVARTNTSAPLWWPVFGAPLAVAVGAATGLRPLTAAATALGALNLATGADIARSRIVPGANDNLSGVAALVALAERLRDEPAPGVRVVLASCGAEEVLQGGIYGFVERHLEGCDRATTSVLNLDSIGSPELAMLEGEGVLAIEEYPGPELRDLVAHVAAREGIGLQRGVRARTSTDSVIPARAGFPTATLISWEPDTKLISNYHLPTDTPENLRYETVAAGARVAEGVARALGAGA